MKTKLVVVAGQTGNRGSSIFNENTPGSVWTLTHDGTPEGFAKTLQDAIEKWQSDFCLKNSIVSGSQIIFFTIADRQDFKDEKDPITFTVVDRPNPSPWI